MRRAVASANTAATAAAANQQQEKIAAVRLAPNTVQRRADGQLQIAAKREKTKDRSQRRGLRQPHRISVLETG